MRVRGFTQDDAHHFCTEDQIEDEILAILDLNLSMLNDFGFDQFEVNLSTRPDKAVGSDAIWEKATAGLRGALERKDLDYVVDEGGGAFYGPKIDVKIEDAIGRKWQCSTVQLDFNLPERFDMNYVSEAGDRRRPIMIHRALLGSLERFFGVLIEHYEGRFPTWLAPVQAVLLTITDRHEGFARELVERFKNQGLRVEADLRNEKIGFKIREHTLQRVPYLLIIGDKELETGCVSVRTRAGEDLGSRPVEDFIKALAREDETRRPVLVAEE
jgi:threonyl-tRNA synthetase